MSSASFTTLDTPALAGGGVAVCAAGASPLPSLELISPGPEEYFPPLLLYGSALDSASPQGEDDDDGATPVLEELKSRVCTRGGRR